MFARRTLAPGLLAPSNYSAGGTQYMVATFASDGAYVLNTSTGVAFGLNSRPAKPGDVIIAYGIGFGDVTPSILPGTIVQQSNSPANPVTLSFGSANATLAYSGLAGGFVGLYEHYCQVRRLNPPTKSKWESRLMTGIECCRLSAAIQTSFAGIGLPAAFSSSRIAA